MTDDILIRLKASGEQFTADVKRSLAGVEGEAAAAGTRAGSRMSAGLKTGLLAAGAGLVAIAAGVGEAVSRSLALGVDLKSSAAQIGVGVEALQEYRNAARETAVPVAVMDANLEKLTLRIGQAAGGNRAATTAFNALGVAFETTDGRARSTEAVMRDVITTLNAMNDPARQAALGAGLLGDGYQQLAPLVAAGVISMDQMTAALRAQNGVLTTEQVEILARANAEYDRMKNILSVNIAGAVAENADGIRSFTQVITALGIGAIRTAAQLGYLYNIIAQGSHANAQSRVTGAALGRASSTSGGPGVILAGQGPVRIGMQNRFAADLSAISATARNSWNRAAGPSFSTDVNPADVGAGSGGGGRSRGGGGGRSAAPRETEEQREAKRLEEEQLRNAVRLTEEYARQTQEINDAATVERARVNVGEAEAAIVETQLRFLRQHPEAAAQTVEEFARLAELQAPVTAADRARLQDLLDQVHALRDQNTATATLAQAEQAAARLAADRLAKQENMERDAAAAREAAHAREEEMVRDLAALYGDLFSGHVGNIWSNFKRLGIEAISEIAARWTLARLAGQPFDAAGALGSISSKGGIIGALAGAIGGKGGATKAGALGGLGGASGAGGLLGSVGAAAPYAAAALVAVQLLSGVFKKTPHGAAVISGFGDAETSGKLGGELTGTAKSVQSGLTSIAEQLGATLGTFNVSIGKYKDNFRVSASGSSAVGNKKFSKKAGADLIYDGKDEAEAIRIAIGNAIKDGVFGGISDASKRILESDQDLDGAIAKALSIEELPKKLRARLDPLGAAIDDVDAKYKRLADTLKEGGASAQQIADARQLWSLERDDAVKQIGDASAVLKNYLTTLTLGSDSPLSGRQQIDAAEAAFAPFAAQIAALTGGKAQVDALRASGASAESIAAAEAAQRARAGGFDQQGFASSAEQLLALKRRGGASTDQFFDAYNRIKELTARASGLIDATVPTRGAVVDPFIELTAKATQNTVSILDTQTGILNAINDNLAAIAANGGTSIAGLGGFIGSRRGFQ